MAFEEIRAIYHAEPFRPFTIRLNDGREIPVERRSYLALDPLRRSFAVGIGDGFELIDVNQVVHIDVQPQESATP